MTGDSTIVAGIEIPSTDPVFLTVVVGIHIPLGIACVVVGAAAMFSKKRRGRHTTFGQIYYWCLLALVASATFLSVMRWVRTITCSFWEHCLSRRHGLVVRRFGGDGVTGPGCTSREWASHTFSC